MMLIFNSVLTTIALFSYQNKFYSYLPSETSYTYCPVYNGSLQMIVPKEAGYNLEKHQTMKIKNKYNNSQKNYNIIDYE